MEPKQSSPAAEALLWVRLVRLFVENERFWRMAETVDLMSRSGCRRLSQATSADIQNGRVDDVRDKNNLCNLGSIIQYVIIDHAVIPSLTEAQ